MRDFTEEEIKDYNESLDSLFVPMGVNIFEVEENGQKGTSKET